MTAVGKILVFMNLLLSVATSGMIVLVFTTRSNWKNEYEKARNVALVAEAAYKSEKLGHQSDNKSRENQLESIDKVNQALVKENDALKSEKKIAAEALATERAQKEKAETNHKILSAEVTAQKEERNLLVKVNDDLKEKLVAAQKEANDQRLIATNNRIEADAQTQKARRLLDRVEELEKTNTQMVSRLKILGADLGSSTGSLLTATPIPAPRDVYGTVLSVAPSGLTAISIGSDSGLSAGNKLFVYRTDLQNPKNSLYLGELVVSRTEPKNAVGQFFPKSSARVQDRLPKENDVVSTSLGSR